MNVFLQEWRCLRRANASEFKMLRNIMVMLQFAPNNYCIVTATSNLLLRRTNASEFKMMRNIMLVLQFAPNNYCIVKLSSGIDI
jgi:hypothetical protein